MLPTSFPKWSYPAERFLIELPELFLPQRYETQGKTEKGKNGVGNTSYGDTSPFLNGFTAEVLSSLGIWHSATTLALG